MEDKIVGIDRELLEEFLILLRDKYPATDTANFFLESKAGISGLAIGITNQRDAFSHFVSFLSKPEKKTKEQLRDQIAEAEEHLRRAIIESYQYAVDQELETLESLIENYKKTVLVLDDPALEKAPTIEKIRSILNPAMALADSGRATKPRNIWDADWEEGAALSRWHHNPLITRHFY